MSSEKPNNELQPLVIHAQYVKDVSFENPQAPQSLRGGKAPEVNIDLNIHVHRIEGPPEEFRYEVILSVTAHAKRDEKTVFLAEVHYGMAVSINNVPKEHHRPMLMIEVPRLAYPYARQIITEMTQAGGFPPIYLHPVNFEQLFRLRYAQEKDVGHA